MARVYERDRSGGYVLLLAAAGIAGAAGLLAVLIWSMFLPMLSNRNEGVGSFPPLGAVLASVAGLALCGLFVWWWSASDGRHETATVVMLPFVIPLLILSSLTLVFSTVLRMPSITIDDTGFTEARHEIGGGELRVILRNTTDRPVTVCVGSNGRCAEPGVGVLSVPAGGLHLPPHGYSVGFPDNDDVTYTLTLVQPTAAHTDTVLTFTYQPPTGR